MLEWQEAKRLSTPASWLRAPAPLPGRRRASPWVHPSSQTYCLPLWRSSSLACKLFSVVVAQICQCWQRWWFDGDIVDDDVQGEQRRRGRPECNAHGGRSAATAPRLSRRFSNRFSWLRKKCLWTFSHLHRPIPSSLRFYVKNVVFVNITKILLIFVWRRVWRQSVSPVWLPNIFHHLIFSQDGLFCNISSNFHFLVSIKKKSSLHRERWYGHSSACSLWQWIKQILIILKKSSSYR